MFLGVMYLIRMNELDEHFAIQHFCKDLYKNLKWNTYTKVRSYKHDVVNLCM
jgi:hypothetical protein